MRLGATVFVLVLAAGCGTGGDAGSNKKFTDLEKRVTALEKELKGEKADKGGKEKGERASKGENDRGDRRKADAGVERGKVDLAGDALKVALVKDGSRIDLPGPVPVGTWEIVARFGEGDANKIKAGSVTVAKGQTLTIECTTASKSCTTR